MKTILKLSVALFSLAIFAAPLHAVDDASPELIAKGRELFNNKEGLGVKFACILCHKQEKAIKLAHVEKAGDKLPAVINKYLVEKAKGKPLAANSEQMLALMAYIRHEHAK